SCEGIRLALPQPEFGAVFLKNEIAKLLAKNPLSDGMIYLQVTRGVAPRNHLFPEVRPTLLFYTRSLPPMDSVGSGAGLKLKSVEDERWKRCWIKSIALLPNVLAKNAAVAAGADEAVFIENGIVSECSASNFFCVIGGKLLTHPVGAKVLPGITRLVLLELAGQLGIAVEERPIRETEARAADEVFITSTTREIGWVNEWDGQTVRDGVCGPITRRLHEALRVRIGRETAAGSFATPTALPAAPPFPANMTDSAAQQTAPASH
ncbi:MAG TPA: aminotransferase class IV, partial [Tepidisphaeraceae bacterium]